jgi:hypothetical protein
MRLRGHDGDLAAIDPLEQFHQQSMHLADLRSGQAHLQLVAFAADATVF